MSPFPPPPMPQPVAFTHSPAQTAAKIVGGAFLAVGILGLVPGSGAALLDVVHLAFGVTGLLAGRTPAKARSFLIGGGTLYLVLFLVDDVGGWLQLGAAAAMITLGASTEAFSRNASPTKPQ